MQLNYKKAGEVSGMTTAISLTILSFTLALLFATWLDAIYRRLER